MNFLRGLAFLCLCVLFSFGHAAAEGEGNVQEIYSAGQMYSGAGGCDSSASKGCDVTNHVWDASRAGQYTVDKYSRAGASVENIQWSYTVPPAYPDGGGNQGVYRVNGGYRCVGDKSWRFAASSGSLCWGSHTLYSSPNCEGRRNVASYGSQTAGNQVSSYNSCSNGACVVDYQPASSGHFITGDTGDNMMALHPDSAGTKGFLIYNYCGAAPYWVDRNSVESSKYLMIPTKCTDYQTFIDSPPAAVTIGQACHPATLSLCPSPPSRPSMPPHPGCGAYAHGASWCSGGYVTECVEDDEGRRRCARVCEGWSSCDCGTVR